MSVENESRVARYLAAERAKQKRSRRILGVLSALIVATSILTYINYPKDETVEEAPTESEQIAEKTGFLTLDEVERRMTPDMYTREVSQVERDRLLEFAENNPQMSEKLEFISENLSAYPPFAVGSIINCPEKLDYILAYPVMRGTPADSDIIIDVEDGELPYLMQWDGRWGYAPYGDGIGFCGCAPTCLSMVAIGLTGNTELTPDVVADYALAGDYYVENTGTSWAFMTDSASALGLTAYVAQVKEADMYNVLDNGGKMICSVSPGDFTASGHFIVISGYDKDGFTVLDPNDPKNSEKQWSYGVLAPQIAGLWAYF